MSPGTVRRLAVVSVIAALGIAYVALDLGRYLSLDQLKASRDGLLELYRSSPALVVGAYFIIYVLAAAMALPAAAVLTLAGGALFGLWTGTVVVSFASTIGATAAFIVARYLLRDWVQGRFGARLDRINRGIEAEGAYYLFTLRMIPVFPFFVVNAVVALTPMRLGTYYWVTQLGMLPATVIYVYAGRELGRIDTPGDLLSPGLLAALVLLGVFPLAARRALAWHRSRRDKIQKR
jgi:uncharacterized membrane protein YdjX (TVP38/TMEM64 family)